MIKETKDLVILVARIATGVSKSLEDGKITIIDAAQFGPALMAFLPAIAGCSAIPSEIASATDADKEELLQAFVEEFKISSLAAQDMVDQAMTLLVAFWKMIKPQA